METFQGLKRGRKARIFATAESRSQLIRFFDLPGSTIADAADFFGCSKSWVDKTLRRIRDERDPDTEGNRAGSQN
jgi:hypothetical protein